MLFEGNIAQFATERNMNYFYFMTNIVYRCEELYVTMILKDDEGANPLRSNCMPP